MENLKKNIWQILILLTLVSSITSCVMLIAVTDTIDELEENDKIIMENMQGNLSQPEILPEISDTIAYYKIQKGTTEGGLYTNGTSVKVHRFFFVRAQYTDSILNGFSVIVAEVGNSGVIIESQDNVTINQSNLGEKVNDWKTRVNELSSNNKPYFSLSDEGLKIRSLVRTAKF